MISKLLKQLPKDKPVQWQVIHDGKPYIGEIMLSSTWSADMGQLPSNIAFRIIFLSQFEDITPQVINCPNLCLFIPTRVRAIREGGAVSKARGEALHYASGQILTLLPLSLSPEQIFSIADDKRRLNYLASVLLFYKEVWGKIPSDKIKEITPIILEVVKVKRYLEDVQLPEGELALDRASILGQLTWDNLLENPRLWESIKSLFQWFKSRYSSLYLSNHQKYYQEISVLRDCLEDAAPELSALSYLNSISELGEPIGTSLASECKHLLSRVIPCPLWEKGEAAIEESPTCQACGMELLSQPPQTEVEDFLKSLDKALREQYRRLSSEAIHLILSRKGDEKVDKFIKVLQSSDPSPLINIMDEGMTDFLRNLLREAQTYSLRPRLLEQLSQKFSSLEEKDIEEATEEFKQILRECFARAKIEAPGRSIRLILAPEDETNRGTR